jgi:cytochrome P450
MALVSLITSPGAYNTLQREIDGASAVSTPITWTQTQTLPYLQSVVRESLRLWHPFCALGSKRVPPGGDNVNGFWVPGGTDISQGYHALGRSEDLWGDDAHVFRPERWLYVEGDELKTMVSALDTHFGSGKNACLGKPIALMELHKTLFEVITLPLRIP